MARRPSIAEYASAAPLRESAVMLVLLGTVVLCQGVAAFSPLGQGRAPAPGAFGSALLAGVPRLPCSAAT